MERQEKIELTAQGAENQEVSKTPKYSVSYGIKAVAGHLQKMQALDLITTEELKTMRNILQSVALKEMGI